MKLLRITILILAFSANAFAANFVDLGNIAQQTAFQSRVAYALNVAAVAAYNESGTVQGHAARAVFAIKVMSGQVNITAVALAVLTNATIAAEGTRDIAGNGIPDSDIQFAINSLFTALAGA